jgi:hypothetical protein
VQGVAALILTVSTFTLYTSLQQDSKPPASGLDEPVENAVTETRSNAASDACDRGKYFAGGVLAGILIAAIVRSNSGGPRK